MPTALITGAPARLHDVAGAVHAAGFQTCTVPQDVPLAKACAEIPHGSLHGYVQLPAELDPVEADGITPASLAELRALISGGLLARFDALGTVAPLLAPDATVVLVTGDRAGDARDTSLALPGVVHQLARAVLDGAAPRGVRARMVPNGHTPADIAAALARRDGYERMSRYAALAPDLNFSDWREEILSLLG